MREGRFRWRLQGDSMRPTLMPGWEIEIAPAPDNARLGSLIVFAHGPALVAHRLVARRAQSWITQGDNRLWPDPPLKPADVLGIVVAAYEGGRRAWPGHLEALQAWFWISRAYALWPPRRAWRLVRRLRGD